MTIKTFLKQSKDVGNSTPNSINELRNYLKGKKIKILSVTGGHNYGPVGTIYNVPKDNTVMGFTGGSENYYDSVSQLIPGKNTIKFSDFVVIENETKEQIEDYIKELETEKKEKIEKFNKQIKNEKLKIEFLKETKNKNFDENEFKSFKALTLLENKELTLLEKSKILAELIKG